MGQSLWPLRNGDGIGKGNMYIQDLIDFLNKEKINHSEKKDEIDKLKKKNIWRFREKFKRITRKIKCWVKKWI